MTIAAEFSPSGPTTPVPMGTEPVAVSTRTAPGSSTARGVPVTRTHRTEVPLGATADTPVLTRLALPVTEPPFDDEIGRTPGRPTAVGAQGRVVYLTGSATAVVARGAVATSASVSTLSRGPSATSTEVSPDVNPRPTGDARPGAPVTAFPVRLHLVQPDDAAMPGGAVGLRDRPTSRRPSPATRGVRPARQPAPLQRPDPSDGFAPGPRVDVDSTATRSRLLGTTDDTDAANRAAAAPSSDPRPLAAQVVQAVVEILAGDRQLTQLTAWVDEEVYAAVAAAAPEVTVVQPSVRRGTPPRIRVADRPLVRSVHVCQPGPGVAEVSARVQVGGRSCAVALRLEGWRGRWRCNALTVG